MRILAVITSIAWAGMTTYELFLYRAELCAGLVVGEDYYSVWTYTNAACSEGDYLVSTANQLLYTCFADGDSSYRFACGGRSKDVWILLCTENVIVDLST